MARIERGNSPDEVLGWLNLEVVYSVVIIHRIVIHPCCLRRGIGSYLMAEVIRPGSAVKACVHRCDSVAIEFFNRHRLKPATGTENGLLQMWRPKG